MTSLWVQTKREKMATIDGLNLFFGALLGANLGTTGNLALLEYAKIIVLLSGLVMTIRMVSMSERRWYAFGTLALYLVLAAGVLYIPDMQPKDMPKEDLHRLALTMGIWVVATMSIEFYPTIEPAED